MSTQNLSPEEVITNEQLTDVATTKLAEDIETIIASLALDQKVMVGQNDGGYLWKFQYGSVEVFVQLTGPTDLDNLTVWAKVLSLPAKDEPRLMRKLLSMNWSDTFESRFAIVDQQVVVISTRSVADLSLGEISRAITVVATIADDNDDLLQAEFAQ